MGRLICSVCHFLAGLGEFFLLSAFFRANLINEFDDETADLDYCLQNCQNRHLGNVPYTQKECNVVTSHELARWLLDNDDMLVVSWSEPEQAWLTAEVSGRQVVAVQTRFGLHFEDHHPHKTKNPLKVVAVL